MGTKLKDIASGGATAGATDKVVGVRSGTTDLLVTPVALDAAQTWTAAQTFSAAAVFSAAVTLTGGVTISTAALTITDVNIVLSATTGTKIGTATGQKLGFWNATPVVQPVFATGAAHTVDELITLLQTLGLCKQA